MNEGESRNCNAWLYLSGLMPKYSQPESLALEADKQLTGCEQYLNDPRTVRICLRVPADKQWVFLWEISQWLLVT